jgi:hypothetical protein
MITENTKYVLRMANLQQADSPARGRLLKRHIIMTPQWPSNNYSFSVCLITAPIFSSDAISLSPHLLDDDGFERDGQDHR